MFDLEHFHWLRPAWLLALPIVLGLGYAYAQRRTSHSRWQQIIDPHLLAHLLIRQPLGHSKQGLRLFTLCVLLACIGLAGPSFRQLPNATHARDDALVILLDLSLSMYAQDLKPSRIDNARHEIKDLLRLRQEGFTGLVVYAGDAHVVTPLTDDNRTIENLLDSLEPGIMPLPGSNLSDALRLAHELLDAANRTRGHLVLVTDEVLNLADVANAARSDRPLSILGIGTTLGAPIPLDFAGQAGTYLKDHQDVTVIARLDSDRLAEAARMGGGSYRTAQANDTDVARLLADAPDELTTNSGDGVVFDVWADDGFWFALPLLPALWLLFRRGAIAALLAFVFMPTPAVAWEWRDLWQSRDQQGLAAMNNGEPDRAVGLFKDERWRATALYRSDRFLEAAQLYQQDNTADGHYNRGNAMAKAEDLTGALAAYEQSLSLDPDHADARFNKALIEQLMQQQTAADDPQQGSQQRDGGERAPENKLDQSAQQATNNPAQPQHQQSGGETDSQSGSENHSANANEQQPGAASDQASDAEREQAAANEQWLNRIPEDPGGLLRRKFEYEYRNRYDDRALIRNNERIW